MKFILQPPPSRRRRRVFERTAMFVNLIGELLVVLFLAASGIAQPSVFSAVYFLSFIGVATTWGCYKTLGKKFAVVRMLLLAYSGAHLLVLYLYQFQFLQDAIDPSSLIARLVQLC